MPHIGRQFSGGSGGFLFMVGRKPTRFTQRHGLGTGGTCRVAARAGRHPACAGDAYRAANHGAPDHAGAVRVARRCTDPAASPVAGTRTFRK